jgi:hypothetical protein
MTMRGDNECFFGLFFANSIWVVFAPRGDDLRLMKSSGERDQDMSR